jgi:hypothetical protein
VGLPEEDPAGLDDDLIVTPEDRLRFIARYGYQIFPREIETLASPPGVRRWRSPAGALDPFKAKIWRT